MITAAPNIMLKPEEQAAIDAFLSELQTGGKSSSEVIDRDWLLEEGNTQPYMLHYFPRAFWQWEPINTIFFNYLDETTYGVALLPGQHGKTTMLGRWFIRLWCIDPQLSIGYTEKNEPTAFKRGWAIMQELQSNKLLRHDFGNFKPRAAVGETAPPWGMGAFTINQRPFMGDSPSFSAFGAGGGSILGWRFNVLVNDDPVTVENSESEQQRQSLLDWFNQAAKTCCIPLPCTVERYAVKHFLIGTPFRMDDLYHTIMKGGEYDPLILQAVVDEQTGATLSPRYAYQNPEELEAKAMEDPFYAGLKEAIDKKKVRNLYAFKYGTDGGTLAYSRRYQCQPLDPDTQMFKDVHFKGGEGFPGCFDTELSYGECPTGWRAITALDPQSGHTTRSSARVGLVTVAANPLQPNVWQVVDLDYGKWDQSAADLGKKTQLSEFVKTCVYYQSLGIIEDNASQAGLIGHAQIEAQRRGVHIRCEPHHTGLNKHETDIGIPSLLPMFECGSVRLPYKTAADQVKSNELAKEFTMQNVYPYSDLLMAFWMAAFHLRRLLGTRRREQQVREIAEYRNRLPDFHYPPHWTADMIKAHRVSVGLAVESDGDAMEEAI